MSELKQYDVDLYVCACGESGAYLGMKEVEHDGYYLAKEADAEIAAIQDALIRQIQIRDAEVARLKSQVERLRTALEFYCDERRYEGPNQNPLLGDPYQPEGLPFRLDVDRDRGRLARAALSEEQT